MGFQWMYFKMEVLETVFILLFYPKKSYNVVDITNENNKEHNSRWQYIPDHPYRMLIIAGSGSGETNALFNSKNSSEPKYEFLIKMREDAEIEHLNDPREFIEYTAFIDDIYSIIDDYNPSRKRKIIIVSDDMIVDIMTNKKI